MRGYAFAVLALVACGGGGDDDDEPPGEPGHFVITGTVRYEDRPQTGTGPLGAIAPKPSRGVAVSLILDSSKVVLAETITDDDGAYSLELDALTGAKVHILVATTSVEPARPLSVRHAQDEIIHGFGAPTFGLSSSTQDVLVTEESGVAEAFNIFDVLVDVMDAIPVVFPGRTASQLDAFWHEGNTSGTFYFNNGLFLLGEASDNDGYDDTVILHESGHWIEEAVGRSDSPGGDHNGNPVNPTLAWSEGFSTYFSLAITEQPIYSDSNAGGGFAFNADTSNTKANINGGLAQNVSEDMIAQILWDLADAPATDDDQVAGSHAMVLAVEGYMMFASLRAVGKMGVDLVDYLDGWFINYGLTSCPGLRELIDVKHTFPYDYGSTAGACPP